MSIASEMAGRAWGNPGLNQLLMDLDATLSAYAEEWPDGTVHAGIEFGPEYEVPADNPLESVKWEVSPVEIIGGDGRPTFREENAHFPMSWNVESRQIVASKYFYGDHSQGFRETSLSQVLIRVSATIAIWAARNRAFRMAQDAETFFRYLMWIQLDQQFSFNSPVYFNVGIHRYGTRPSPENYRWDSWGGHVVPCEDANEYPQVSACFIQSVDDNMRSIMSLAASEAYLFKRGSGTGTDLSTLRSRKEKLSGGGAPSGPVSFMRMYDAIASIVKSGGKTRRAAKMQTLKYWHPDIKEFVECKREEEKKARTLIRGGYDPDFNGEAYSTVAFQNANLSVRVDDVFMQLAQSGHPFETVAITTGEVVESIGADDLLTLISECAWDCGDPALQFEDRIQEWHTVPNHGPINSSNPCSEYMHIDNSACNLGSVNAMRFYIPAGWDADSLRTIPARCDVLKIKRAVRTIITAMETMVDSASYPTEAIAKNSHDYRPLGAGFADVGSYVMINGLPYDSDAARALIANFGSLLTAESYCHSARLAARFGAFPGFAADRDNMLRVIRKHRQAHRDMTNKYDTFTDLDPEFFAAAESAWAEALELGERFGYRNSQVTVIAPTGTIAFMMGCQTLGAEPEIALVRFKTLAGGGKLKLVNRAVPEALRNLGYREHEVEYIVEHISKYNTIEDVACQHVGMTSVHTSGVRSEHLAVFDCAFSPAPVTIDGREWKPTQGRSIAIPGHVKIMADLTPFVSGAISKTANVPNWYTPSDIKDVYVMAWELGCKSISVYRDGSKGSQPVTMSADAGGPGMSVNTDELVTMLENENETILSDVRAAFPYLPPGALRDRIEAEYFRGVSYKSPGLPVEPSEGQGGTNGQRETPGSLGRDRRAPEVNPPARFRMPTDRDAKIHKFSIAGHEGFIISGLIEDGSGNARLGEVFIEMSKQGSTLAGLMDTIGVMISLSLQHNVPLPKIVEKLESQNFEPKGLTPNPDIRFCKSVIDYVARYLGCMFIPGYRQSQRPLRADGTTPAEASGPGAIDDVILTPKYVVAVAESPRLAVAEPVRRPGFAAELHGDPCPNCGALLIRQGMCMQCFECGFSEGGCGG